MNLSEISIRRPVLATVMSLLIVLFGGLGFIRLGIREYPAVDPPVVTVTTSYRGANPEIIDTQITEPLEQTISGIAGIRNIASTSREGSSEIRVEFTLDSDLEAAANDVRDKVSQAIRRLPADADPPTVEKADADSDPIIFLAIQSSKKNILEVSDIADTVLKERFQTIPGVSSVRIFGEKRFAMRLWLDPGKMAAHGVTPQDVFTAVDRQNVDLPSGLIEGNVTELSHPHRRPAHHAAEEFNRLIIRQESNRQILQFATSGEAELSTPRTSAAAQRQPRHPQDRHRRRPPAQHQRHRHRRRVPQSPRADPRGSSGGLHPRSRLRLHHLRAPRDHRGGRDAPHRLRPRGPDHLRLPARLALPSSSPCSPSPSASSRHSSSCTWRVTRSTCSPWWPSCSPSAWCVDDAIVVLENIYTKVEGGARPYAAAVQGTREIFFAVISTTVTLATVFVPVLFLRASPGGSSASSAWSSPAPSSSPPSSPSPSRP